MYKPNKRDKLYLAKWKRGKSIGYTMRSSLKAKGLIPRANGTRRVSNKYMRKGGDNSESGIKPVVMSTSKPQPNMKPIPVAKPMRSIIQPVQNVKSLEVIHAITPVKHTHMRWMGPREAEAQKINNLKYNAPLTTIPTQRPIPAITQKIMPGTITQLKADMKNGNSNMMTVSESQIKNSPFSTTSNEKVQFNLSQMPKPQLRESWQEKAAFDGIKKVLELTLKEQLDAVRPHIKDEKLNEIEKNVRASFCN